jgi:hypothetical protein
VVHSQGSKTAISDLAVNPLDLFEKLDKTGSKIKGLRLAQREVLQKYYDECQNASRVGIRLPTGAGKTLVALLILEAWRRSDRNVAILAASTALAQDIESKAKEIGIPAVSIFGATGDHAYRQQRIRNLTYYKKKNAIGVFNYHSYLYSTQYRQEIVPPHVLVIDDANEFETVRSDYFTLRIDRDNFREVYDSIIERLRPYFQLYPNLQSFLEGTGRSDAVEVIHFTHSNQVMDVIHRHIGALEQDLEFKLSYERNSKYLDSCLIFVTADELEFRPLIIPEEILKLSSVPQIVFMGATLYSSESLHRSFGIRELSISLLTENRLSLEANLEMEKFGRRLILPVDISKLGVDPIDSIKKAVKEIVYLHRKVLVLANSKFVAHSIQTILSEAQIPHIFYRRFEDGEKFKSMNEGVLICANRYVGLDFPGGTCKVTCIVTLPMFLEPLDMFQYSVLNNYPYAEQKLANRLTQAFGRCNRLESDQAVYYVLDPRILARFTGEELYFRYFPARIHAEIYTGFYLSEGGSFQTATEYAKTRFFGTTDPQFEKFYQDERKNWKDESPTDKDSYFDAEIEAWEKSLLGSYETSAQLFDLLAERMKARNELMAAWQHYVAAMNYRNAKDQYGAGKARKQSADSLQAAIDSGGKSSWFNHLRAVYNEVVEDKKSQLSFDLGAIEIRRIKEQIVADYDNFIDSNNSQKKNWRSEFNVLKASLQTGTHGQMLDALVAFVDLLGYKARKGDNSKGEPDIIAVSSLTIDKYQLAIEAKTKKEGEEEKKENVNQALGNGRAFGKHTTDYHTFPVLITQKETFSADALRVASDEVSLFRVEEFNYLLDKLYSRMDKWSLFTTSHQRHVYIDSVISPHELLKVVTPREDALVTKAIIDESVPNQ